MGAQIPPNVPCSKGPVCFALDEFSAGPGARSRVRNLRDAIADLAPGYVGLAETFDQYLLRYAFNTHAARQAIVDHLNTYWFDPDSPSTYFPGVPVIEIYAEGVLQALELSLNGEGPVVPFDAWWVLGASEFVLLSFVQSVGGATTSDDVTLLIETPRPIITAARSPTSTKWILGPTAEAYVTRQEGRVVTTSRVKTLKPKRRPRRPTRRGKTPR